jgi:hypothetical protein
LVRLPRPEGRYKRSSFREASTYAAVELEDRGAFFDVATLVVAQFGYQLSGVIQ